MTKAYDRRYFAFLGFLSFLGFLGFLGNRDYQHLSQFASLASAAPLAVLVFIPRRADGIPIRYQLQNYHEIFRAMVGQI